MLTAFILEDEQHCIDRLLRLLENHSKKIQILGQSGTVKNGLVQIKALQPDIVFMDVELEDGNCFDLLKEFEKPIFNIIFTTAHDRYAVQAFEYSAVHYLLKPVDPELLEIAVARTFEGKEARNTHQKLEYLSHNFEAHSSLDKKIAIPTPKGLFFYRVGEIVRVQAEGNYCTVFLSGGQRHLVTKQLKYYEELFDGRYFFRTHHKHLVHLAFVDQYVKSKETFVKLSNGEEIPVSVRRREAFFNLLAENQQI